jgi:hypothetical protein
MNAIIELFKNITSNAEIVVVQNGFLYEDRVDRRAHKLFLKDFVTLVKYLLTNKYLAISFEIEGQENANEVLDKLKKTGASVEVLRNELNWIIELQRYEVDILLTIDLPHDRVQSLVEAFYIVEDAVLIYPVGYMSWGEYFQKNHVV